MSALETRPRPEVVAVATVGQVLVAREQALAASSPGLGWLFGAAALAILRRVRLPLR